MNCVKNVAAYCRVSTDHADQLNSLSSQIKYFNEYICQQDGWRLKETYYDEGISGTSVTKRDNFNRMINDAENGLVDLILTKEVSRFARNTVDTLQFTRKLSALGVAVVFMNDNINTLDKDGELRLTIMASIAQEESRKTSERVKWGMKRKMESGMVFGNKAMLGYRIEKGVITIEPKEAELVRRIFNTYAYGQKGANTIAKELNNEGIFTIKGNPWTDCMIYQTLKNEKYVGDLVQGKYYTTDFLTKKRCRNTDNPLVIIENHHEGIIDRETWDTVQKHFQKRGAMVKEGLKYSGTYWFSNKVKCGLCNSSYATNTSKGKTSLTSTLSCRNRRVHGKTIKTDGNGAKYGCTNIGVNEQVFELGMKSILDHIHTAKDEIIEDLLTEIKTMQSEVKVVDVKVLEDEIERIHIKKRTAIDLMLESIITKEDLKKQTAFYDSEIVRLTNEITQSRNTNCVHDTQVKKVKEYIKHVNDVAASTDRSTDFYRELLERAVVNDGSVDFYLCSVPLGFKVEYHTQTKSRKFYVFIDSCMIIERKK